jgi:hypothetical protein
VVVAPLVGDGQTGLACHSRPARCPSPRPCPWPSPPNGTSFLSRPDRL